jgi:putative heme-binding domain-containing protein
VLCRFDLGAEKLIRYLTRSLQLVAAFALLSLCLSAQSRHARPASSGASGQQIFASACASCHGLDGRGGERAPNIAQAAAVQRLSDQELTRIVTEGVAGTGMPAFHSLGAAGVSAVVKYLRVLQGRSGPSVLPGVAAHGQDLFFGRAGCSSCHMVGGRGGFLASDLSGYGKAHSVDEIREAILNPGRDSALRAKNAVVTTKDGARIEGIVRNEDNFSIQLQSKDGAYHFIDKADAQDVRYDATPVMPNYESSLSRGDLNDVVSYLVTSARNSKAETASEQPE